MLKNNNICILKIGMKLNIKEIPVPTDCDHPKPPSPILPKHEFTMGIVAPKGQGKTTLMINFILFYKNFFKFCKFRRFAN